MKNQKNRSIISKIGEKILKGDSLTYQGAVSLNQSLSVEDLPVLFDLSNQVREEYLGRAVKLCSIANVKNGSCGEDCIFCAQSSHHHLNLNIYHILSPSELIKKAAQAEEMGVDCFGLVASGGKTESTKEIDSLCETIQLIRQQFPDITCAASLGMISYHSLCRLKEAGLQRYHHNLETAEVFFPKICTTHSFQQRRQTIETARAAGLQVCSGGLFGLGETIEQRFDLAISLSKLKVDSIPINFLHPIEGTGCSGYPLISPLEALKTIAMFRLILPKADIKVCGGRGLTLRTLQSWIFLAGANGLMVGDYLTTKGTPYPIDKTMVTDLGLYCHRDYIVKDKKINT